MSVKWIGTKYKGVRYYEHPTRKLGKSNAMRDKYFSIRYQRNGIRVEEGIGWSSELDPNDNKHWTAEKAALVLAELKEAGKGIKYGPARLKERRDIDDQRKKAEQEEQDRRHKEAITFGKYFTETYLPDTQERKKKRTAQREEGLYKKWLEDVIGGLPLKEIAPFHLQKIKKIMADKKQSPRSIVYALAVVRQVFNTARAYEIYEGKTPSLPKKEMPKVDNGRTRFLTKGEAAKLLAALAAKSTDVHDMTMLSLHAGLRFGEIASLTWQDVDLEHKIKIKDALTGKDEEKDCPILNIRDAKAGSRVSYLTEQAAAMLRNRPKGEPSNCRIR